MKEKCRIPFGAILGNGLFLQNEFCVTNAKKYPAVGDAALRADPKAFIVTTDVRNVNGRGHTLARKLEAV